MNTTKPLGQIWADEMNGTVKAGTFRDACFAKTQKAPSEALARIANGYRQMPYGGAPLHLSDDGTIDNGMYVVTQFASKAEAQKALKATGFRVVNTYYKLAL